MAQSLGYQKLKQTEIDRFYEPQCMLDDKFREQQVQDITIKAMKVFLERGKD